MGGLSEAGQAVVYLITDYPIVLGLFVLVNLAQGAVAMALTWRTAKAHFRADAGPTPVRTRRRQPRHVDCRPTYTPGRATAGRRAGGDQ